MSINSIDTIFKVVKMMSPYFLYISIQRQKSSHVTLRKYGYKDAMLHSLHLGASSKQHFPGTGKGQDCWFSQSLGSEDQAIR